MNSENTISGQPATTQKPFCSQDPPEVELWEPPFERWIRLADELLRECPLEPAAKTQGVRK